MFTELVKAIENCILLFHTYSELFDFYLSLLEIGVTVGSIEVALFAFWLDRQRQFLENYKIRDEANMISQREERLATIMRLRYKTLLKICTITLFIALIMPVISVPGYFFWPSHIILLLILFIMVLTTNIFTLGSMLFTTWQDESNLADMIFPLKIDSN